MYVAVLLAAMVCLQIGAAIAKTLLPLVGAAGASALRLTLGSLMLIAFWRPWRMLAKPKALGSIAIYGASMGCMNLAFYSSLRTIPLGIAVAVEFTGPLALAMFAARRAVDFLWIALAALGLLTLLPIARGASALDPAGIGYALGAGAFWALYIVFGKRAGTEFGGQSTALGMLAGAIVIAPVGLIGAGTRLFAPALLPAALGVALLSSALPYSLEMFAMTRVPTRTFGVLMSLEPAIGALCAFWFLGESLSGLQWAAIGAIMLASGGSAATARVRDDANPAID